MKLQSSVNLCRECILLLLILVPARTSALCPSRCKCSGDYPSTDLTVDCGSRKPDIDRAEQLTQEIDVLLSSNLTYGQLKSLRIANSPLTEVPRYVCLLTTLTELSLDSNRLRRLPDNCFANLTSLKSFSASRNYISELQDGLFDGLSDLVKIDVSYNIISSIGLRLFNTSSNLTSLRDVNMEENKLQTLEPWPFYLGLNGRLEARTTISLCNNDISTFTNGMGWQANCSKMVVVLDLILCRNSIKHFSDLLHGWGMSFTTWWCFSRYPGPYSRHAHIDLDRNSLECDCVDFDVYRSEFSPLVHDKLLSDNWCHGPESLYGKKILEVPLDQLVCEVTEGCPVGCRCVHRPANATLHVYCSNRNLTALPLKLPALPKSYTKYKLDLSNNRRLNRLEHRDYLVNTFILDISNCNLDSIDLEMWDELANVSHVLLDGNRLQSLPQSIKAVNLERTYFSFGRNPWKCSCEASWMSDWLNSVSGSLTDPNDINCASPSRLKSRNVISMNATVFCEEPRSESAWVQTALVISLSLVVGVVAVLLSLGLIVRRLRVKLYSKWKFHPFDRDECLGEDMDYDLFFSCSSEDHDPEGRRILETAESKGYRVCYHYRDFMPGLILDNIEASVSRSKRTVCLLTKNFIRSAFCLFEFELALHHWISKKRSRRLIVLMALDNPSELESTSSSDTGALRQYLRQYTYIDYTADDWIDKLLYALPLNGMDNCQTEKVDDDDSELLVVSNS